MLQFSKPIQHSGLLIAILLSGCSTLQSSRLSNGSSSILRESSTDAKRVEVTMLKLLNGKVSSGSSYGANLVTALTDFDISKPVDRTKRNEMQDYLKAISNQNCVQYKSNSLSTQSSIAFGLDATSTILATAAVLLKPVSTAKALAGSSAALNGIQSQVSENFYREKTFEVITRAINIRRKELWANIERRRMDDAKSSNERIPYSVNRAIADAVEFNSACSLIEGFEMLDQSVSGHEEQVDKAVEKVTNPEAESNNKAAGLLPISPPTSIPRTVAAILAND